MTQIPVTTSGTRCLITNQSNEDVTISGIRIHAETEVDLFVLEPTLTESEVLGWMQDPAGPLYYETTVTNRLHIVDVDFLEEDTPNLIYGNQNRVVFKRSRDDMLEDLAPVHIPIATAGGYRGAGVKDPELVEIDNLLVSSFTVDSDQAHKTIKIPLNFVDNPAVHLHWTKTQDTDQSGNRVKWQVSYTVYNGYDETIDGAGTVTSYEQEYVDNGADSHVVYRTINLPINTGITAGKYVAFKIEAIAPSSNTLAEPGLITMDFTYRGRINRNPFDIEAS